MLDIIYRQETDSLGRASVPQNSYYGIQTQRALENFPISNTPISSLTDLVYSLACVKKASALANKATGAIESDKADAIIQACDEIMSGALCESFVVDIMQGGAGTSTNMNANEVIANRAIEILGYNKGDYHVVHPNDHVNCSQSTNDSYATAVRLSLYFSNQKMMAELKKLQQAFEDKAKSFANVQKLSRTQLQDAVPMYADAEINAYAITIAEDIQRAEEIGNLFLEVNLGGTAIGSGIGASQAYFDCIIEQLSVVTKLPVKRCSSLFEASWDMGAFVLYSSVIKRIATKLSKIANDLRLLSSGPYGGIGEYILPEQQPGSSIMPGKVNPVIPEVLNLVCFRAIGVDTSIAFAAEAGQLQLNAFEPLIVSSLSEIITMMMNAMKTFRVNCIDGLKINEDRCKENLEASTAMATYLVPHIGYDAAVKIAKSSINKRTPFFQYVREYHPDVFQYLVDVKL